MIHYIRGKLIDVLQGSAVIEVGGIGLSVETPPSESNLYNQVGQDITIYTRLLLKDEEMLLYGFKTPEECKLFNLILSVSGFGPRLALSLLGVLTVPQLYVAVLEENIAQLSRAHGVGRKAAQRLVLELKEKLPKVISAEELITGPVTGSGHSLLDEVIEALCALGYSQGEAASAVSRAYELNKEASREELLKAALKSMVQGKS